MKSFKSAVFTLTAALFLAVSLVGCKDNDAQTAVNNGGLDKGMESIYSASSSVNVNSVKLVLRPGAHDIYMGFFDDLARDASAETIKQALASAGIVVKDFYKSEKYLFVSFDPIVSELPVSLDKVGLRYIQVKSPVKDITRWDPSLGNEAKHVG